MVKLINQDPMQLQDIYVPLEEGEESLEVMSQGEIEEEQQE